MNVEKFRHALKQKWLAYYQDNRDWLVRLGVWVTCQGQRRPSSSFILAALSTLEPKLTQLLPLVVDLNNNPDRIVISLGLNFNPDEELARVADEQKRLPSSDALPASWSVSHAQKPLTKRDEDCVGVHRSRKITP
ncbi:MAG: DUF5331 domain-containing protein [Leptolyngbya sp. SIO4C1]|nr:DUF5331 domain-containing protein [Leptolyngbya sp. SIO4C1]